MNPQQRYEQQQAARGRGASRGIPNIGFTTVNDRTQPTNAPTPLQDYYVPKEGPGFGSRLVDTVGRVGGELMRDIAGAPASLAREFKQNNVKWQQPVLDSLWNRHEKEFVEMDKTGEAATKMIEDAFNLYKSGKISKERYQAYLDDAEKTLRANGEQAKTLLSEANAAPKEFYEGIRDTFIALLSGGRYVGLKSLATGQTGKTLFGTNFTTKFLAGKGGASLAGLESIVARIPSIKDLLVRNGANFANANRGVVASSVKDALTGILFKQPFVYNSQIEDIESIVKNIVNSTTNLGDLVKFGFILTNALSGGLIGASWRQGKKFTSGIKLATLGRASFFDRLSTATDGNPRAWLKLLDETTDPAAKSDLIKRMRQFQEHVLRQFDDNVDDAVDAVKRHYSVNAGREMASMSIKEIMERETKYLGHYEILNNKAKAGELFDTDGNPIEAGRIALGTLDRKARDGIIIATNKLSHAKRMQWVNQQVEEGRMWAQHELVRDKVINIFRKYRPGAMLDGKKLTPEQSAKEIGKAIRAMDAGLEIKGLPAGLKKAMKADGYFAILPKGGVSRYIEEKDTRKLVTEFIEKGDEVFDTAVVAKPALNSVYGGLTKIGLGLGESNQVLYRKLSESVTSSLDNINGLDNFIGKIKGGKTKDISGAGKIILTKLQNFAEKMEPNSVLSLGGRTTKVNAVTDIRQLNVREIGQALNINLADAKKVSNAIKDGYMSLPLEMRGLGDRAVDMLFKYVPGFRWYNRLQSALRYTYSPFFRTQEIAETAILSRVQGQSLLWGAKRQLLDETVSKLDDARMFNTGFTGSGARDDVVLGRITASMTHGQKRNLAGLALKIAKKHGTDIDDMIKNHFDELEDALKIVVQYPSKGVLNSAMARTLNLAFFPIRYNLKVTMLVAKSLSQTPPTVQYAFINSALEASEWLKSDEGLIWQAQNSEAIGILKWLTPYGSIDSAINLLNGRPDSISDIGQLGGLPLGFFIQLLESQGVFRNLPAGMEFSTPYVNQQTGEVYTERIPVNLRGSAALALTDFINSTFTYPGRVLGLPGKGESIRSAVERVIPNGYQDYERVSRDEDLTKLQRRQSELLKQKAIDDMNDDELLDLFATENGVGWSTPNLPLLVGVPKEPIMKGKRNTIYKQKDNKR